MNEFLDSLRQQIEVVERIGDKIEHGEAYMEDMRNYLPSLNQMITTILDLKQTREIPLELNHEFVFQVLNDIIYGIENEDSVFLLDVLRYGLLEIYYYIGTELQSEEQYE